MVLILYFPSLTLLMFNSCVTFLLQLQNFEGDATPTCQSPGSKFLVNRQLANFAAYESGCWTWISEYVEVIDMRFDTRALGCEDPWEWRGKCDCHMGDGRNGDALVRQLRGRGIDASRMRRGGEPGVAASVVQPTFARRLTAPGEYRRQRGCHKRAKNNPYFI